MALAAPALLAIGLGTVCARRSNATVLRVHIGVAGLALAVEPGFDASG